MAAGTLTVNKILPYLRRCGYKGQRLRENYVYYSANKRREVSVAGFSQEAYSASTACIAVLDGNRFAQEDIEKQVESHQFFGGSVILVCRDNTLQFWHFSNGSPILKEQKKGSIYGK